MNTMQRIYLARAEKHALKIVAASRGELVGYAPAESKEEKEAYWQHKQILSTEYSRLLGLWFDWLNAKDKQKAGELLSRIFQAVNKRLRKNRTQLLISTPWKTSNRDPRKKIFEWGTNCITTNLDENYLTRDKIFPEPETRLSLNGAVESPLASLYLGDKFSHPIETVVADEFARFITGPCATSLKKCDRCHHFYLHTTKRKNKRYCSAKCGARATAEKSTKDLRATEQRNKIKRVRQAIAKFERLSPAQQERILKKNWEIWAAKASRHPDRPTHKRLIQLPPLQQWQIGRRNHTAWLAKEAGVTTRWLTRTINKRCGRELAKEISFIKERAKKKKSVKLSNERERPT
jgi:hypothetical protein